MPRIGALSSLSKMFSPPSFQSRGPQSILSKSMHLGEKPCNNRKSTYSCERPIIIRHPQQPRRSLMHLALAISAVFDGLRERETRTGRKSSSKLPALAVFQTVLDVTQSPVGRSGGAGQRRGRVVGRCNRIGITQRLWAPSQRS